MNFNQKQEIINKLKPKIKEILDNMGSPTDKEVEDSIVNAVFEFSSEDYLSPNEEREIVLSIFNSLRRLDVIQPLLDDVSITEIMVNGPNEIFIERNGKIEKTDIKFENEQKLEEVINNIVSKVNRTVNQATPIADARLKDGSRISAVVQPIALNGPILTIRKFPKNAMTANDLITYGSLTPEASLFLENLVKSKYNIFISGGTGSGKTTFLNALSNFIPKDERIITIEDSAELQIKSVENIVKLETRNANTSGKGEITIKDLIKASLRMRPERIIVGEVRGSEALDMLQAMNTGHDGSLSTGHANSTQDMLSRLETMVLSGAAQLPLDAIRQQIASAIDIIIHLSRLRDKTRRTLEISEVLEYRNGEIKLNPLFIFVEDGQDADGKVLGQLKRTKNKLINTLKIKNSGIELIE